jgi:hypothetical protein
VSEMGLTEGLSDVRGCVDCSTNTFHDSKSVLALGPGGAQRIVVWVCEHHPIADCEVTYELTDRGISVTKGATQQSKEGE